MKLSTPSEWNRKRPAFESPPSAGGSLGSDFLSDEPSVARMSIYEKQRAEALAKIGLDSITKSLKSDASKIESTKDEVAKTIKSLQLQNEQSIGDFHTLKSRFQYKKARLEAKLLDLNKAYEADVAKWNEDYNKRLLSIEEEQNNFVQFQLAYEQKMKDVSEAEAKELSIVPVPNAKFRALFKSLPKDLSDVDPNDLARHMELVDDTDLEGLTITTKCAFLRTLHLANYHLNPDVAAMWNGKGLEWKSIHGQEPCALARRASHAVLNTRITTLLKLQTAE